MAVDRDIRDYSSQWFEGSDGRYSSSPASVRLDDRFLPLISLTGIDVRRYPEDPERLLQAARFLGDVTGKTIGIDPVNGILAFI